MRSAIVVVVAASALALFVWIGVTEPRAAAPPAVSPAKEDDPVVPRESPGAASTPRLMEMATAKPPLDRLREEFSGGGFEPTDEDLWLEYRRPYIEALGRRHEPDVTRFLIGLFVDDRSGHQILMALEGHPASEFRRRVALTSPDAGLRKTALATATGDEGALSLCVEAFERDDHLEVRKQALLTLSKLGPAGRATVEAALEDPNPHIRQAARTLLDAQSP